MTPLAHAQARGFEQIAALLIAAGPKLSERGQPARRQSFAVRPVRHDQPRHCVVRPLGVARQVEAASTRCGTTLPAEQARIVQLLVARVDVRLHGVEVRLRPDGLAGLMREVAGRKRAAA